MKTIKTILLVLVVASLTSCGSRKEIQHGSIGADSIEKSDEYIYTLRTADTTSIYYQNKITLKTKVVKVY